MNTIERAQMASNKIAAEELSNAFLRLADCLRRIGFTELLAAYGSDEIRTAALEFDLPLLPPDLRLPLALFVLGEPAPAAAVRGCLPEEAVDALVGLGILEERGEYLIAPRLQLSFHYGVLVFHERPTAGAKLYYGNDSLALGRLLLPVRGRVLDLCTGVGTQAFLCALTAEKVVAVDREPAVRDIFAVNAALNGLVEKAELRLGDLIEPAAGERFDHICCNPPLLPVPHEVPYPPTGDDGPDGLGVVRRVLTSLPDLLANDGRCHLVGSLLGDQSGPRLEVLRGLAEETRLDILLILPRRESLTVAFPFVRAMAMTSAAYSGGNSVKLQKIISDSFETAGATYLYPYLMLAVRSTYSKDGGVRCTRHYLRGAKFWTV